MRALKVGLALLVSAAAFAGLWAVGTMDVASAATAETTSIEPEPAALAAAAAAPGDELELVLPDEIEVEETPSGIEVPDLSDTTALRAFRRGRELGFVVDVRDEEGRRVAPSERLYMRVLSEGQTPPPGSFAEAGSTVRVVARYPRSGYASGY